MAERIMFRSALKLLLGLGATLLLVALLAEQGGRSNAPIVNSTQLSIPFKAGWTFLWPTVGPVRLSEINGCSFSSAWSFDRGQWRPTATIYPSRFQAIFVDGNCTATFSAVLTIPFTDVALDQSWHLINSTRSWNAIHGDCSLVPGTSSGPLTLLYDTADNVWQLPMRDLDSPMDALKATFVQLLGPCRLEASAGSQTAYLPLLSPEAVSGPRPPEPPCPPLCVSPPEVPLGLVATAQSNSQIFLTWQENSNDVAGFNVERRMTAGEFIALGSLDANLHSFLDEGLSANTTYCYRMNAFSLLTESAFSDAACATTFQAGPSPPSTAPPAPPTQGPDTIAQAIDKDHNNLIDDDEMLYAIGLWVNAVPIPGLASPMIIDDEEILRLVALWVWQTPITS